MNTIISGVMIDKLWGAPDLFDTRVMSALADVGYDAFLPAAEVGSVRRRGNAAKTKVTDGDRLDLARILWFDLHSPAGFSHSDQQAYSVLAYRAARDAGAQDELLRLWRQKIGYWTPEDKQAFVAGSAASYRSFVSKYPQLAGKAY